MDRFELPEDIYNAIQRKEDIQMIQKLMEIWKKDDSYADTNHNLRVLYCACVSGHSKFVDELLQTPRIFQTENTSSRYRHVNEVDHLSILLVLALYYDHRMIATSLVRKGANFFRPVSGRLLKQLTGDQLSFKSYLVTPMDLILFRDDVDTFNDFMTDAVLQNKNELDLLIRGACIKGALKCFEAICQRAPIKMLHDNFKSDSSASDSSANRSPRTPLLCDAASRAQVDFVRLILDHTKDAKMYRDSRGYNAVHYALQAHHLPHESRRFYSTRTKDTVRLLINSGINKIGHTMSKSVTQCHGNLSKDFRVDTYLSFIIRQISFFHCIVNGRGTVTVREQKEEFPTTMRSVLGVLDEFKCLWQIIIKAKDSASSNDGLDEEKVSYFVYLDFIHPLEEWYLTTIDFIRQFYERLVMTKMCHPETHLQVTCNGLVLSTAILQKLLSFPAISFLDSDVDQDYALFGSLQQILGKILNLLNKKYHVRKMQHLGDFQVHLETLISLIHAIMYIFLRQGLLPMNEDLHLIRDVRDLKHTSCLFPIVMTILCALPHADYYWAVQLLTETRNGEETNSDDGDFSDDTDSSRSDDSLSVYLQELRKLKDDAYGPHNYGDDALTNLFGDRLPNPGVSKLGPNKRSTNPTDAGTSQNELSPNQSDSGTTAMAPNVGSPSQNDCDSIMNDQNPDVLDPEPNASNNRISSSVEGHVTVNKTTTNHVHHQHHLKFDPSTLKDAMQCLVGQVRTLQSLSRLTVYQTILRQGRDYDSSVKSLKLPTPLADYLLKFEN